MLKLIHKQVATLREVSLSAHRARSMRACLDGPVLLRSAS
jgi:hypothetical protein